MHRRQLLKSLVGLAVLSLAPLAALAPRLATGGITQSGCYIVGSSLPLRMQYNLGPAKWLQNHCMVYSNARRQMVSIPLKGRYS